MLLAQNVGKRFGSRVVLRNVNFSIQPASVVGVVGRNGAGKSTLLRLTCELLAPSRGTITWNGTSTRAKCALFAPDAPLARELTCLENLRFFAQNRSDETALRAHLASFSLGERAGDLAGELSSGLRARLGLCVAAFFAMHDHPILLLDEPTANLDEAGRSLVESLVQSHRARSGVTLLATNDARDLTMCDFVVDVGGAPEV